MPFPKGRPPTVVEFGELLSHMTPELWEIVRSRTPAGYLDQLKAAFEESRAIVETYERKPMQTVKRNWGGGHIVRTVYAATTTTRAKHTRKTTPTSPSWRFANEPNEDIRVLVRRSAGNRAGSHSRRARRRQSDMHASAVGDLVDRAHRLAHQTDATGSTADNKEDQP